MAKLLRAKGIGIGFIQDADSAVSWDPLTDETVAGYYTPGAVLKHTAPNILAGAAAFDVSTGWTVGAGWTIAGGVATHTSGTALLTKSSTFTPNCYYRIPMTVVLTSGTIQPMCGMNGPGTARSASGTYSEILRCGANTTYYHAITGFVGTIDDVMPEQLSCASIVNRVVGLDRLYQATPLNMPFVDSGRLNFHSTGRSTSISSLASQAFLHQASTIGLAFRLIGASTRCLLSTANLGDASSVGVMVGVSSAGALSLRIPNGAGHTVDVVSADGVVTSGADHVLSVRVSPLGYSVRLDGSDVLSGPVGAIASANPTQSMCLGNTSDAGTQYMAGDVRALVLASGAYSLAKTIAMETLLT